MIPTWLVMPFSVTRSGAPPKPWNGQLLEIFEKTLNLLRVYLTHVSAFTSSAHPLTLCNQDFSFLSKISGSTHRSTSVNPKLLKIHKLLGTDPSSPAECPCAASQVNARLTATFYPSRLQLYASQRQDLNGRVGDKPAEQQLCN